MKTYHEFNESEWARIERDWGAWWAGELDRPIITVRAVDPDLQREIAARTPVNYPRERVQDEFLSQFPLDMPAGQVLDVYEPLVGATRHYGDAYPKLWINFGAGVAAAFLGAGVEYQPGTTWFHKPEGITDLAQIRLGFDPDNVWLKRIVEITQAAVARWGHQIAIGMTDVGGNLDILASLRGTQELLTDLYDAPDEVERLAREITALWLRWYDILSRIIEPAGRGVCCWAPCWNPGRGYMLQSDFSYMISPKMFARYVTPDLTACCAAMDYGFYHMDGKGQIPHLDHLLGIERLRGIQWQPGDGAPRGDQWPDLLRRIREGGKLCQVYVTRQGAFNIVREFDGGRGFLIDVDEPLTCAQAEEFMEEITALMA